MKKYLSNQNISASIIPRKQQALDTLSMVKQIYESDTSGLLTGGFYSDFMHEVNEQIKEIQQTIS